MTIKFSKTLYTRKAILLASEAYAELANFSVSEVEKDFIVTLKNIDSEFKEVVREEYCNYVLALMKK